MSRTAAGQLHDPVRDGLLRGPEGVSAAGRIAQAVPPARKRHPHEALHGGAVHAGRAGGPVRGSGARRGGAQPGDRLRARLRPGLGARRLRQWALRIYKALLAGRGRHRGEPEPGALVRGGLHPGRLLLRRWRHLGHHHHEADTRHPRRHRLDQVQRQLRDQRAGQARGGGGRLPGVRVPGRRAPSLRGGGLLLQPVLRAWRRPPGDPGARRHHPARHHAAHHHRAGGRGGDHGGGAPGGGRGGARRCRGGVRHRHGRGRDLLQLAAPRRHREGVRRRRHRAGGVRLPEDAEGRSVRGAGGPPRVDGAGRRRFRRCR